MLAGRELALSAGRRSRRMELQMRPLRGRCGDAVEAALEPDALPPRPVESARRSRLAARVGGAWSAPPAGGGSPTAAAQGLDTLQASRYRSGAGQLTRARTHTEAVFDQLRETLLTGALADDGIGAAELRRSGPGRRTCSSSSATATAWQARLDALDGRPGPRSWSCLGARVTPRCPRAGVPLRGRPGPRRDSGGGVMAHPTTQDLLRPCEEAGAAPPNDTPGWTWCTTSGPFLTLPVVEQGVGRRGCPQVPREPRRALLRGRVADMQSDGGAKPAPCHRAATRR